MCYLSKKEVGDGTVWLEFELSTARLKVEDFEELDRKWKNREGDMGEMLWAPAHGGSYPGWIPMDEEWYYTQVDKLALEIWNIGVEY